MRQRICLTAFVLSGLVGISYPFQHVRADDRGHSGGGSHSGRGSHDGGSHGGGSHVNSSSHFKEGGSPERGQSNPHYGSSHKGGQTQHENRGHSATYSGTSTTPSMSRSDSSYTTNYSRRHQQASHRQSHRINENSQGSSRQQINYILNQSRQQAKLQHQNSQGSHNANTSLKSRTWQEGRESRSFQTQFNQRHQGYNNWFNDQFYANHNANYYENRQRGVNWWGRPQWSQIQTWLPLGWTYPVYYDDGFSGYSVSPGEIQADEAYQRLVDQAQDYSQLPPPDTIQGSISVSQNQNADQVPAQINLSGDLLPLGVFAVGRDSAQAAFSSIILQLALDKNGDIVGIYYNTALDRTYKVEGVVDKDTQRAVWKLSNDAYSPIMSTGIYNMTRDVIPIQVRFPRNLDMGSSGQNITDMQTIDQTWTLVRLKKDQT